MRKLNLVLGGLTLGALVALPSVSQATIVGSQHDFSAKSWNTRASVCGPCHSIHNTDAAQLIPLWSHKTTAQNFTPYHSPSMKATVGQPDGVSKACLSCHDGTVAINDYGGVVNGTPELISSAAQIGKNGDLTTHHPVSFNYDAGLVAKNKWLYPPDTTTVPLLDNQTIKDGMLVGDKLQCSSCHDVHKQKGVSSSSSIMLVIGGSAGAGSKLCLTCHNK